MEFAKEWLPIVYVTVLPLLCLFCACCGTCNSEPLPTVKQTVKKCSKTPGGIEKLCSLAKLTSSQSERRLSCRREFEIVSATPICITDATSASAKAWLSSHPGHAAARQKEGKIITKSRAARSFAASEALLPVDAGDSSGSALLRLRVPGNKDC